ncbi:N-6 DNA methylase [Arthrobacter sunyaminii]|uniref:site-specific DNA-methyltransferase (adenine-specific) n=1 Tax=Arthrobacter sunyaminii TaxID=2816859 RepID=A0A975S6S7_9MICC|nr:N-6 DNA methylase [Arthrobacter sunyaminii]MBO0907795.1 N-6 DNA methylase [Arthrobacter sunyaminii]QWQ36855.1 N-6 DNA methylase [Arthrobacter sunyaminii]
METAPNQELINLSGIARITGLKMPTISNWRKRDNTFPKPVSGSDLRPLFALQEVKAWIKKTGKNVEFSDRNYALRLTDMLRGRYHIRDIPGVLIPALALSHWARDAQPDYLKELSNEGGLQRLVSECTSSWPQKTSLLSDAITSWFDLYVRTSDGVFWANLLDEVSQVDDLAAVARDVTALAVRDPQAGYGEHFATPDFSEFLLSLLPTGVQSYADFGSGGGQNLLCAAERDSGLELHGVEISSSINRYAACLLYLHGVEAHLQTANLFDWAPIKQFDQITMHAPFGIRLRAEEVENLVWPFGKPPLSKGDTAWLQLAYQALREGGTAAVAVAPGVLFRGGTEKAIMQRMVAQGAVEAVISLPSNTQLNTGIPVSIILLKRGKESAPREVLMVDVSESVPEKEALGKRNFTEVFREAAAAVETWRKSSEGTSNVSVSVPIADLMAPDANLMPQRWVTSMTEMTAEAVEEDISSIYAAAKELGSAAEKWPTLPDMYSIRYVADEFPLRPLPELGLEVLRGDYVTNKAGTDVETSATMQVMTPKSIRTGIAENLAVNGGRRVKSRTKTQKGDVLVTTVGSRIEAMVCPVPGLAVDRNVNIVRGLGNVWDADFVAQQLMAHHNQAMRTGTVVARVDVRQLLLPQLPIERQHEVAQIIREVSAFTAIARRAADKADAYLASLRDAISTGRIRIDTP